MLHEVSHIAREDLQAKEMYYYNGSMVSYSFMTWSRSAVQKTPFQSQGSESRVFQLDKVLCGSS